MLSSSGGDPSVAEEDDRVVVSQVDSMVPLHSQSGGAQSSTVGTLELRFCDRRCSVGLFAASSKALASLFFKLC